MRQRIIVGFDGSEHALAALTWAVAEARLSDSVLVTLAVLAELGDAVVPPDAHLGVGGEQVLPGEAAGLSVPVQSLVVGGDPGDVLVRESEEADLLVVGSRGNGTVVGLLLGSTSDCCARHAACPVMVVRSDQTDGE